MRVIIIDDEPQSHRVLENHLLNLNPPLQVVGNGASIEEGLQLIAIHQPDLVFLDIELPDGLGFELMRQIHRPSFVVIFITAHNKYAQQAIRYGALDYILKPIDFTEFEEAIKRLKENRANHISQQQLQVMWEAFQRLQQQQLPSTIAIHTLEGILYRNISDIVRLQADRNYTYIYFLPPEKSVLASLNIGSFEDQFVNHPHLMKVHRSSIINLHQVDKYVKADGGYLVMKDGVQVSVSKAYKNEVLKRLENL